MIIFSHEVRAFLIGHIATNADYDLFFGCFRSHRIGGISLPHQQQQGRGIRKTASCWIIQESRQASRQWMSLLGPLCVRGSSMTQSMQEWKYHKQLLLERKQHQRPFDLCQGGQTHRETTIWKSLEWCSNQMLHLARFVRRKKTIERVRFCAEIANRCQGREARRRSQQCYSNCCHGSWTRPQRVFCWLVGSFHQQLASAELTIVRVMHIQRQTSRDTTTNTTAYCGTQEKVCI